VVGSSPEVLIVEPNADDEMLTRRMLRHEGLAEQVAITRTNAETLAWLASGHRPVVIFIDLGSPFHMGVELISALRGGERTRAIPIVVMVGGRYERELLSRWLPTTAYVEKPVAIEAFRFAIAGSRR
jgi:CheY-like chemotaxis protein